MTALLSCLWLVLPVVADAQSRTASVAEARGLFEAGSAAYEAERYEEALEYFERAYELLPDESILYNAARSAERAGSSRAAALYRRLAESSGDPAQRAEAVERAQALEAAATEPPTERGVDVDPSRQGAVPEDDRGPEAAAEPPWSLIFGIPLMTVGAAGLAAGIVGLAAPGDCLDRDAADRCVEQQVPDVGAVATYMVLGGLALAAGLTWILVSLPGDDAGATARVGLGRIDLEVTW